MYVKGSIRFQFLPHSLHCLTECPPFLSESDGILQLVDALLRQPRELNEVGLGEVVLNEDAYQCGPCVHTFFAVGVEERRFVQSVMAAHGCHRLAVLVKNNASHKNNSLSSVVMGCEPHIN